jgi:hypothetical protein
MQSMAFDAAIYTKLCIYSCNEISPKLSKDVQNTRKFLLTSLCKVWLLLYRIFTKLTAAQMD